MTDRIPGRKVEVANAPTKHEAELERHGYRRASRVVYTDANGKSRIALRAIFVRDFRGR